MVTGKILWFGGQTREGRVNNFGFIQFQESGEDREIYVNRQEVPEDLQNIFENDRNKGEGIIVEFDIQESETSGKTQQQATNLKLLKNQGLVLSQSQVLSQNGESYSLRRNNSANLGDVIEFYFQQNQCIFLQLLNYHDFPIETIKTFCDNKNIESIKGCLGYYLSKLNQPNATQYILNKTEALDINQVLAIFDIVLVNRKDLFLASDKLRQQLKNHNISRYSQFVEEILNSANSSQHENIIQELIYFLPTCSEIEQALIWRTVSHLKNSLEYHGNLWEIAPLKYKQEVIRKKYAEFFTLVEEFKNSGYPYSQYISGNRNSYTYFNANDNKLIEEWMPEYVSDDKVNLEKARLISARGAEKLVKYFYEQNGKNVEDIAVHQVNKRSQDWIKGDIRVNSSLLLDVKNARKSTNSNVYSEFCVPEFKKKRGNDVLIAAVFSPYNFFDKEGDLRLMGDDPTYLGEMEYSKLISLINIFSDDSFEIDLSRGFDPNNYLPPWLFDYNSEFYLNQIELSQQLKKSDIPSYQDLKLLDSNLIYKYADIFVFGNYQLPESWVAKMPKWAAEFYKSLHRPNNLRLSLPYLYLSILKHFLQMLSLPQTEYQPQFYKMLLGGDLSCPCKIYDPLQIIDSFCETLETLWEHRNTEKLKEFKVFKFNGQGFLKGKPSKSDRTYTTILAYCGGWTDSKGKCGYTPLVIGKHRVCEECGYLICPKDDCHFCSRNCSSYEKRKQGKGGEDIEILNDSFVIYFHHLHKIKV